MAATTGADEVVYFFPSPDMAFFKSSFPALALAAGKSCTISVTFKPTAKGASSASLAFTDNGGSSPSIALSGTGA